MKNLLWIAAILLLAVLLVSCLPASPKEVKPYCQQAYTNMLVEYPDLPNAFLGACMAYFQTGNATAFVSLCAYEPIWGDLGVTSKAECVDYFKNYTEP